MTKKIEAVDTHHHPWDLDERHYSWLNPNPAGDPFPDFAELCRSYRIAEFRADYDTIWDLYREVVSPPVAAQLYWDECAKRGDELFADMNGLEAYIEAADVVIDHADLAAMPLFAGTAQLTCSDAVPGRAMQKAAVLRELRGGAHLIAVLASGLSDAQAHAIKRPGDVGVFGWEEAPEVPIDGDIRMDAAEDLTNTLLERAFFALTVEQADALVAGTVAMHAALNPGT